MHENVQILITIGSPFVGDIRITSKFRNFNCSAKCLHRFFTQICLHVVFSMNRVTLY